MADLTEVYDSKLDERLKKKYDKVIKRIEDKEEKKDALVLFEGDEGEGKTNHSVAFMNYVAEKTGRELSNKSIRFDAEEMINEAKHTKRKIFCWDEPALKGLKRMWWDKTQIQLCQLLMMGRKNQHLFVFNLADFSKFNEYLIRRAFFMIRVYKRKEGDKVRRFLYYPRKRLRKLHDHWSRRKSRAYVKYHTIHGTMPNEYVLPLIIDESIYEQDKDNAIKSIGEEAKKDPIRLEYDKMVKTVLKIQFPITITSLSDFAVKILNKDKSYLTKMRLKAIEKGLIQEEQPIFAPIHDEIIVKGLDDGAIKKSDEPLLVER